MPEQISEKKSVQQEFLESEKYVALKKEVFDSVSLGRATKDMDIAPAFDYFEKELIKNGISEIPAEKLFWQTVTEKIKETRFKFIDKIIRPEIENKEYALARRLLTEELNKTVEELSHTLYANLSRKDTALRILKEEFYKIFPDVESLLEETEEEKRAKIKRPAGELGQGKKEESEEKWEKEKSQYLVEELEWPVPKGRELIPGLTIVLLDRQTDRMENIEFIEYPYFENGDLLVKVKWYGKDGIIKLASFGLAADMETGLWNSRYKPLFWEVKQKNK